MIPYRQRFHGHASLKYVFKNGRTARDRQVILKFIENPRRKNSRFAVIVSKKIHKSAVKRNRIRRRIYEIIRQEIPQVDGVYDVAIVVSSPDLIATSHEELNQQIKSLFRRSGLYK